MQGDLEEALKLFQDLANQNPRDFRPYLCQVNLLLWYIDYMVIADNPLIYTFGSIYCLSTHLLALITLGIDIGEV